MVLPHSHPTLSSGEWVSCAAHGRCSEQARRGRGKPGPARPCPPSAVLQSVSSSAGVQRHGEGFWSRWRAQHGSGARAVSSDSQHEALPSSKSREARVQTTTGGVSSGTKRSGDGAAAPQTKPPLLARLWKFPKPESVQSLDLDDGMAGSSTAGALGCATGSARWKWASLWFGGSGAASTGDELERDGGADAVGPPPPQLQHPALQLLRSRVLAARAAAASAALGPSPPVPLAAADGAKLALVIEGGGMRGCVSGGALGVLGELGLAGVFDAVYGSSAGAINATYFLTGQREGVHIYHEHIAHEGFLSLKRLWKKRPRRVKAGAVPESDAGGSNAGESGAGAGSIGSTASAGPGSPESPAVLIDAGDAVPVLNLAYLIDHVMTEVVPLDWSGVLHSHPPLKVVASSLDSLGPVLLQDFVDAADLRACLRASAAVPEIAGGPVTHRGHRLVDAAVFEAVPFRSAVADGATHAIVLCTRPRPPPRRSARGALAEALESVVKRALLSPAYMAQAWRAEYEALLADGCSPDEQLAGALDDDGSDTRNDASIDAENDVVVVVENAAGTSGAAVKVPEPHARQGWSSHSPPCEPSGQSPSKQLPVSSRPWFAGAHVYPVYPGPRAGFSPLCTDVSTLRAGVLEGRAAMLRVLRPLLADVLDFTGLDAGECEDKAVQVSGVEMQELVAPESVGSQAEGGQQVSSPQTPATPGSWPPPAERASIV